MAEMAAMMDALADVGGVAGGAVFDAVAGGEAASFMRMPARPSKCVSLPEVSATTRGGGRARAP